MRLVVGSILRGRPIKLLFANGLLGIGFAFLYRFQTLADFKMSRCKVTMTTSLSLTTKLILTRHLRQPLSVCLNLMWVSARTQIQNNKTVFSGTLPHRC